MIGRAASGLVALATVWLGIFTCVTVQAQTIVVLRQGEAGYMGAADAKILSASTTSNYGSSTDIELDGDPDKAGLSPSKAVVGTDVTGLLYPVHIHHHYISRFARCNPAPVTGPPVLFTFPGFRFISIVE